MSRSQVRRLEELAPAVHAYIQGRRHRGVPALGLAWLGSE